MRRANWITTGLLVFAVAACSLIVDPKAEQCSGPGDCAKFSGTICQQGFCVSSASTGNDGGGQNEGGSSSSGGTDAGDGGGIDSGCVPATSTPAELANDTCTSAECVPFDNCARLGVCDGGLPALVVPPPGGVQ
jgi:hypothetical protein